MKCDISNCAIHIDKIESVCGEDIRTLCEIIEALGRASLSDLCRIMQMTGYAVAAYCAAARDLGLIELKEGYYQVAACP